MSKASRWPLEGVIPVEDWKDRCGVARHETRLALGDAWTGTALTTPIRAGNQHAGELSSIGDTQLGGDPDRPPCSISHNRCTQDWLAVE